MSTNPIQFMNKPHDDQDTFNALCPLVREWFINKFKELSPPQKYSILNIHNKENTLISSPTGSGKTLSAFTSILNELIKLAGKNTLENKVYCIYISPLKALANDIEKNLNQPLEEIKTLAETKLKDSSNLLDKIRVGIRTGDTTASEKSAMLKKSPHIIITTPESLAIMLTSSKFRETIAKTEWVIVDEIHAIAASKRGTQLSLCLERLNYLAQQHNSSFTRIGLSATVSPLDTIAKFLVGMENPELDIPRKCKVIDVQDIKQMDLKVLSPVPNLIESDFSKTHEAMYNLIDRLIQDHKTTLIFTNTRSATERVVHHLKDKFPKNYTRLIDKETATEDDLAALKELEQLQERSYVGAHHGSLSKEHRLNIENRLKEGKLKCVVSSTSLELGIDIGYIDLVILLGSPKSVARALQRIGRSGHKLHDTAQGRIIVLDRDDLVECSVLLKSAIEKKIDKIDIPENCLDVLAQEIFGMAIEEQKHIDTIQNIVKSAYPYRNLKKTDFIEVIRYLAGQFVSLEERNVYAKIWYDETTGMVGKRGKLARVLYMTNVGTIPDETSVKVKIVGKDAFSEEKGQIIGRIDEGFLERLKRNDVFVLGGNTYEFLYAQGMTAFVKSSVNRPPTVPSWVSETLPLSFDLAIEIQKFRRYMEEYYEGNSKKEDILKFINKYLYVDEYGANAIYEYFNEQYNFSIIPHDKKLVIEYFSDREKKYIIFHSLYGRRVNDVLSRVLGYIIAKLQHKDVEININDNGFYILTDQNIQASRAFKLIKPEELRKISELSLDKTEVLSRRFRHCASRALMILRSYMGKKKSVSRQQLSSRLLINSVRRISEEFPILKEAKREVLEDLMDIKNAELIIKQIESGRIKVEEIQTEIPSPFAFNLITMGYQDIMKIEDKQAFLRKMHDMVRAKISLKNKVSKEDIKRSEEELKQEFKKENMKFSYNEFWSEQNKKLQEEKDETKELLKHQAWNIKQLPFAVREHLIEIIDGTTNIRTDFITAFKQYRKEIEESWPKEIKEFITKRLIELKEIKE